MNRVDRPHRILMLLENAGIPEDHRVVREAKALMELGCEITIICPTVGRQPWYESVGGIHVYRFPNSFSPSGLLGYVWEYGYSLTMFSLLACWVCLRRGFDVVHVHTPPDLTALVAIAFQVIGKRFVFDHHDLSPELYLARRGDETPNFLYRLLRFFERIACRRADRLIATNQTQQQVQIARAGAQPAHCYIVRNGPDEAFLRNTPDPIAFALAEKIILGYVGIIGVQDGVDYMVRMVQDLKHRHQRTDFLAVIIGHGPALSDLKQLSKELDVENLIRFTGRVPFEEVPRHIAGFDICLTPDPSNPYNDSCTTIKTMEYMAMRKPTVCFRTKENEVTAGPAALYADDNDIVQFTDLVVQLMDHPEQRSRMGQLARKRVEESLTWDRQAGQLQRLYRDLLGLH